MLLLDLDISDKPKRRTALLSVELAKYNIDIVALSGTHLSDEGQIKEAS